MSNRSSRFVHPLPSLTSALAGGPRRLPALAAVLALLVLALLPTTGQAQTDTTPPALESATVLADGTTITLVFDEHYDSISIAVAVPIPFSVTADGSAVTIGGWELTADEDSNPSVFRTFQLKDLSPTITYGQTVTVSYTDPTTGDDTTAVIQDAAGNDVASFTTGSGGVPAVTHQGRITEIDLTSDPGDDDTYAIGDAIEATVTFSGAVTVTDTPQMALDVGGAARRGRRTTRAAAARRTSSSATPSSRATWTPTGSRLRRTRSRSTAARSRQVAQPPR